MTHAGWRPLKFENPKELENLLNDYFDSITIDEPRTHSVFDKTWIDKDWNEYSIFKTVPTLNNLWEQIIDKTYISIPSILWMCEYLDIHRSTLIEYEIKKEFSNTIKKAKQRIEQYNSDELFRDKNVTGIIFNLKNNFWWVDKQEIDNTNTNIDATESLNDEQKRKIATRYSV